MASLFVLLGVGHLPVDFSESVPHSLPQLLPGVGGLEVVVIYVLQLEVVDEETGGHHVVLVDVLYERLHSGFLDELFLVVRPLCGDQVPGDSCDKEVGEFVSLRGVWGTLLPVS